MDAAPGNSSVRPFCQDLSLPTSTPNQDFHLDHEPLTTPGCAKTFSNLVAHAALQVWRQLNELLTAQSGSPFDAAEVRIERCELNPSAFYLYLHLAKTRTPHQ